MFQDRSDAGLQLAQKLKIYQAENPIILALPRGGVPVGYEVALALHARLDVIVARKIGAPWNPELGVGAIAPDVEILDTESLNILGITVPEIVEIIEEEKQEVKRRQKLYQQGEELLKLNGETVILVDDGVATGVTTRAALQAIQKLNPAKLILAVPLGPVDTIKALSLLVDDLICLEMPSPFYAVGAFYMTFPQVSDEEVIRLLRDAKERRKNDVPSSPNP